MAASGTCGGASEFIARCVLCMPCWPPTMYSLWTASAGKSGPAGMEAITFCVEAPLNAIGEYQDGCCTLPWPAMGACSWGYGRDVAGHVGLPCAPGMGVAKPSARFPANAWPGYW
eukprot:4466688-Prymnesium_polylepis.3